MRLLFGKIGRISVRNGLVEEFDELLIGERRDPSENIVTAHSYSPIIFTKIRFRRRPSNS